MIYLFFARCGLEHDEFVRWGGLVASTANTTSTTIFESGDLQVKRWGIIRLKEGRALSVCYGKEIENQPKPIWKGKRNGDNSKLLGRDANDGWRWTDGGVRGLGVGVEGEGEVRDCIAPLRETVGNDVSVSSIMQSHHHKQSGYSLSWTGRGYVVYRRRMSFFLVRFKEQTGLNAFRIFPSNIHYTSSQTNMIFTFLHDY